MPKNHTSHRPHQIIRSFEAKAMRKRPFTQRFADWLTSAFGTVWFLLFNLTVFATWIIVNLGLFPGVPVFDPYPFVLLITTVSLEAIVLAIVVLISQNRQSQIATLRDELQLQVELITEKEITKSLNLLRQLLNERKIEVKDAELEEMLEAVDTSYIERKLQQQLTPKQDKSK